MDKPIYCKDCGTANSFKRAPELDVKSESGKIVEYVWKCACGHKAYIFNKG